MATATTLEGAIASLLAADAGVSAIAGGRVYPFNSPASLPRPKLTYWRWDTDRDVEVGGFTNDGPTGFAVARFFIDAWADDRLTVIRLAAAARRAINGRAGTVGTVAIGCVRVASEREQAGALVPGREVPVQRQTLDVRVSYLES